MRSAECEVARTRLGATLTQRMGEGHIPLSRAGKGRMGQRGRAAKRRMGEPGSGGPRGWEGRHGQGPRANSR